MPNPQALPTILFQHVESFNDLAVFLWLARHEGAFFATSTIAAEVGIAEAVTVVALTKLTEAGLVAEHHCAPSLFRSALTFAPPATLIEHLGAQYREK